MQRLLGPHLLQPASTFQVGLTLWRPPVCVVFMDHAFTDALANRLKYSTHEAGEPPTHAQVAELKTTYDGLAAVKADMNAANIQAYIKPFVEPELAAAQLAATKLVGRIFIDDRVTRAHIEADPAWTAQFHHWIVTAARECLAEQGWADRVNYWVIVNEILSDTQNKLRQLGRYEKRRLALAGTAYGCGLYAFANANPPLLGSPHGGQQLYDAATTPALPHEFAHWRDADPHGLATVLAEANRRNRANRARERRANALTQPRRTFKLPRHVLLLHQYFKPDDTMDVHKGADQEPEWESKQAPGVWRHPAPSPWLTALNKAKNVRRFEQRLYAWFKAAFPDLKVIVSEYGADGRIGRQASQESLGWKKFDPWTDKSSKCKPYLMALRQLEGENQPYRDVIEGYCLFGLGMNAPKEFWSYRIDYGPNRGDEKQHENEEYSIAYDLLEKWRPRLSLKDTAQLFAGPDTHYAWEATGYASPRKPDYGYPIVGKRGEAWWQILYHAERHKQRSPVWVRYEDVEDFGSNRSAVCPTLP